MQPSMSRISDTVKKNYSEKCINTMFSDSCGSKTTGFWDLVPLLWDTKHISRLFSICSLWSENCLAICPPERCGFLTRVNEVAKIIVFFFYKLKIEYIRFRFLPISISLSQLDIFESTKWWQKVHPILYSQMWLLLRICLAWLYIVSCPVSPICRCDTCGMPAIWVPDSQEHVPLLCSQRSEQSRGHRPRGDSNSGGWWNIRHFCPHTGQRFVPFQPLWRYSVLLQMSWNP